MCVLHIICDYMVKSEKSMNTIKLCVYFHTSGSGFELQPKVAFKEGWVSMPTNHTHGIRASDVKPIYFGSTQGPLIDAITKCLKENKIKLINSEKQKEYKQYLKMKKEEENFYDSDIKI